MALMSLIEEELQGPTVFKDLAKLDFDYVPDELPHRDDAYRFLTRTYKGLAAGASRENVLVWGPVGTGKTALAKRFASDLASHLGKQHKRLEYVHVNCRRRKTAGLAMHGILQKFDAGYPDRGFSVGEMARDLRTLLERRDCHLMVILDEVDALIRADGGNLVYDLTRFNDESGQQWHGVSLVLISQQMVLDSLDDAALSTFKRSNVLRLDAYGADHLEGIVNQRVDLAFNNGTVDPETVSLIADTAGEQGDARLAIELLWKSGLLADDDRQDMVTPEHARAAKAETYSVVTESKLRNLPPHPLMALLAVGRRLRRDGGAYTTTGAAEEAYHLVCEEYNEPPRGHTQYWKYLKQLQDAGFIYAKLSGSGQAGTTQLLSVPDIPVAVMEKKILDILAQA